MYAVRPRLPQRCVPKSGAVSDGRLSGDAQGCVFLGGVLGRKAALRHAHDGCKRCSPGSLLLTDRLRKRSSRSSTPIRPDSTNLIGALITLVSNFREIEVLRNVLLELAGRRLLCHCKTHERYHADELSRQFLLKYTEAYAMGWSDDAPPHAVAQAMAGARREVDDGAVSDTSSEDEPLFLTHLGLGPRISVGSGPSRRDVHDGCGRFSPVWWRQADRRFLADPFWLEHPRLLWEAASGLTSGVLFRDLALCSIVESPFAPRDVVFLEWQLEGRLARRGPLRRQEAEDGIAVTPDWAFLSVLPILDDASECIALAAGVMTDVGLRLPHATRDVQGDDGGVWSGLMVWYF